MKRSERAARRGREPEAASAGPRGREPEAASAGPRGRRPEAAGTGSRGRKPEADSPGSRGREPEADRPAPRREVGGGLVRDVAILLAAFGLGVGVAEVFGAANLGVAFGVGQVVFALTLIALFIRA
jgi:hypothetical protein